MGGIGSFFQDARQYSQNAMPENLQYQQPEAQFNPTQMGYNPNMQQGPQMGYSAWPGQGYGGLPGRYGGAMMGGYSSPYGGMFGGSPYGYGGFSPYGYGPGAYSPWSAGMMGFGGGSGMGMGPRRPMSGFTDYNAMMPQYGAPSGNMVGGVRTGGIKGPQSYGASSYNPGRAYVGTPMNPAPPPKKTRFMFGRRDEWDGP